MGVAGRTLSGKVCLVTGATSGIGAVTARALAERGATVVLVGRSTERCQATASAIHQAIPSAMVEWLTADLTSQDRIRTLATQFLTRHPRLDILVNNAGAMFFKRQESVDSIEMTFALNHLAYFLLTTQLLDALKAAAPSRIVSVASDAHRMARGIDFDDLMMHHHYGGFRAYSRSKLANLLFTYELARKLEGTGVTANALHPGLVATSIFAGNGPAGWCMRRFAQIFAIPPEEGARTSIYLATAPELENVTGKYFVKERPADSSPASHDASAARRLWEVSEELTAAKGAAS